MCICSRLTYCIGNIIYILERLASCCALTSVVTCIIATLLIMLTLGIGLGYNYCYVDIKTGRNKDIIDAEIVAQKPVEMHVTTSKTGIIDIPPKSTTTTMSTTTPLPVEINSTIVAPLNVGINFRHLINKIREKKQNVTLELIL